MDGLGVRLLGGGEDGLGVEIGTGQSDGLVGLLDERGVGISIDEHGDAAHAHRSGGAEDPAGDLAAVGDEHAPDRGRGDGSAHSRNTPYPSAPSTGRLRTMLRHMPRTSLVSLGSMMPSSLIAPVARNANEPLS